MYFIGLTILGIIIGTTVGNIIFEFEAPYHTMSGGLVKSFIIFSFMMFGVISELVNYGLLERALKRIIKKEIVLKAKWKILCSMLLFLIAVGIFYGFAYLRWYF